MQPYFFPYLGHFALIANVDRWLVFDVTQYTPKSWMSRNRILHPAGGVQYVSVSLANSSISIKTHEARIQDRDASRRNILGKLTHYRRFAPYYTDVVRIVDEVFSESQSESLVDLNVAGLEAICRYLGIPFVHEICSRMHLNLPVKLGAGEWAPTICNAIGATEYLNPASGRHLFSMEDFEHRKIQLKVLEYERFVYPIKNYVFEPDLSILDVLMWNSPSVLMNHIRATAKIR